MTVRSRSAVIRIDGVDRVFSTNMDWLCAECPSEPTLANSAETLLPDIITHCLYFVGDVVSVRAGLLSKERVETILISVRLAMDKINKENGVWRETELVTKAGELGLSPSASNLDVGVWIARCPGTNHSLPDAAKAKSVLLRLLQSRRWPGRTWRVRCPEKGIQLAKAPELTS